MLTKEKKHQIIKQHAITEKDTGSTIVQMELIAARIKQISEHLKQFPKDKHSQHGLLKLVGKKRRLSTYLQRTQKKVIN